MRFRSILSIFAFFINFCFINPFLFVSASDLNSCQNKQFLLLNERLDKQEKEIAELHKRVNFLIEALLKLQNPSKSVKITDDDVVISIEPDSDSNL